MLIASLKLQLYILKSNMRKNWTFILKIMFFFYYNDYNFNKLMLTQNNPTIIIINMKICMCAYVWMGLDEFLYIDRVWLEITHSQIYQKTTCI